MKSEVLSVTQLLGTQPVRATRSATLRATCTSSPHASQMCFSFPIPSSEAPAESINCHNQRRLFSIPQDPKHTKQNH